MSSDSGQKVLRRKVSGLSVLKRAGSMGQTARPNNNPTILNGKKGWRRKWCRVLWSVVACIRLKTLVGYSLSNHEYQMVKELYDVSGGLNSFLKIRVFLSKLGQNLTDEELSALLSYVKYRQGFVISLDHIVRCLQRLKSKHVTHQGTEASEAFVALGGNTDGSGDVSVNQLREVVKYFDLTVDIEKLLQEYDTDASGVIEYPEFNDIFESLAANPIAKKAAMDVDSSSEAASNDPTLPEKCLLGGWYKIGYDVTERMPDRKMSEASELEELQSLHSFGRRPSGLYVSPCRRNSFAHSAASAAGSVGRYSRPSVAGPISPPIGPTLGIETSSPLQPHEGQPFVFGDEAEYDPFHASIQVSRIKVPPTRILQKRPSTGGFMSSRSSSMIQVEETKSRHSGPRALPSTRTHSMVVASERVKKRTSYSTFGSRAGTSRMSQSVASSKTQRGRTPSSRTHPTYEKRRILTTLLASGVDTGEPQSGEYQGPVPGEILGPLHFQRKRPVTADHITRRQTYEDHDPVQLPNVVTRASSMYSTESKMARWFQSKP